MVLDHALYHVDGGLWVRATVTRAALPLFLLTAGHLWSRRGGPSLPRCVDYVFAGLAATVLTALARMPLPEILSLVAVVGVAGPWVVRYPAWALAAGLLQWSAWPIPWGGYQLGCVLAWVALGVMAGRHLEPFGERLPAWLQAVGRRPLAWYLGHLVLLAVWQW